jgi:hypothetical protein
MDVNGIMNYQLNFSLEGGRTALISECINGENKLVWVLPLKSDDKYLSFSSFFSEDRFLLINDEGGIRTYSASKQCCLQEKQYPEVRDLKARLSECGSQLFLVYTTKNRDQFLEVISTDTLEVDTKIDLDEKIEPRFFQLVSDRRLLFYKTKKDWGTEVWEHGYHDLNLETKEIRYYPMTFPAMEDFEPKAPVLDIENNIGIMPYWDQIEIKENKLGEPLYIYKIALFDLTDFEIKQVISVREFPSDQLDCYDYSCKEMEEGLGESPDSEEYQEAMAGFIENLNSITVDSAQQVFWLCFRTGAVRRVNYQGEMSPIWVVKSLPNFRDVEPFGYTTFHSRISSFEGVNPILSEHGKRYRMLLTDEDFSSKESVVSVEIEALPSAIDQLIISDAMKDELDNSSKVMVVIDDLNNESCCLDALNQLITLTQDLDSLVRNHELVFRIKDENGFEEQDTFFKRVASIPGALDRIEQVIKNYVAYGKSLSYNCETAALSHAVHELISVDSKYIELTAEYLGLVDPGHEVSCHEWVIPALEAHCEHHRERIIKALSNCGGDEWLYEYFNDENELA